MDDLEIQFVEAKKRPTHAKYSVMRITNKNKQGMYGTNYFECKPNHSLGGQYEWYKDNSWPCNRDDMLKILNISDDFLKGIEFAFLNFENEIRELNTKKEIFTEEQRFFEFNVDKIVQDKLNKEREHWAHCEISEHWPGRHPLLAEWRYSNTSIIPQCLKNIKGIQVFDLSIPRPCFVYFLLNEKNEVVYVGQTANSPEHRLLAHKKNKNFKTVYILPVDRLSLNETETHYIQKFKPIYNISKNRRK